MLHPGLDQIHHAAMDGEFEQASVWRAALSCPVSIGSMHIPDQWYTLSRVGSLISLLAGVRDQILFPRFIS
jgi:hypothetical protein